MKTIECYINRNDFILQRVKGERPYLTKAVALPATDYAALLAENDRRGADCIALLARAETAEAQRDEAVRALRRIADGPIMQTSAGPINIARDAIALLGEDK